MISRDTTQRLFAIGSPLLWLVLAALFAARIAVAAPDTAARQEADRLQVEAGVAALLKGGAQGLAPYIVGLREVLTHMPEGYRKIEPAGATIRYRAENDADLAAFSAWSAERAKAARKPAPTVVRLPDTYLSASFLLAWYYNDTKEAEKALAALEPGLAAAPMDPRLLAEKGQALIQLRRFGIALAHYDQALGADAFMTPKSRALLLRAKGFSLTELRRFDEAEAAYREALVLEPDHVGARNELAYIARVRGGGAATPLNMTTYDKAKRGQQ